MYKEGNQVDEAGLRALRRFDPFESGRFEAESRGGLSDEQFEGAVRAGLLFEPNLLQMTHDQAVAWLLRVREELDPREEASRFVASLSTGRLDFRAGLGALAIARAFPAHDFAPRSDGPFCAVCGLAEGENELLRNEGNRNRFEAGGLVGTSPLDMAFILECQRGLSPVSPLPTDVSVFESILAVLRTAAPDDSAKKGAVSRIRKVPGFRERSDRIQLLLETLGYLSVLETPEHRGFLTQFVQLGAAPRTSARTDWRYPVDFWRGRDGVNEAAVDFWFGHLRPVSKSGPGGGVPPRE